MTDADDGIPFMLTAARKKQLRERGYSDEQIANMTPQAANNILNDDEDDDEKARKFREESDRHKAAADRLEAEKRAKAEFNRGVAEFVESVKKPKNKRGANGGARFQLTPFEQITLSAARTYLVKGLIPRVGLVVAWGPPKCGKSFWTFDLVLHVALGWEYRGRKVQQGDIVYCAFEGADGFKARVEAFRRAHSVNSVPFFLVAARMNMVADHADLITSIRAQLGDRKPVAVVLDTLNRSMTGSESHDEDMANYVKAADAIREAFGCVVIIVHHCGIEGTRPRGHTSLTGAVDAQLALKRDTEGNVITKVEFMKDGPEGAEIVSQLEQVEVGTDDDGDPITSCIVRPSDAATGTRISKPVTGAAKIALDLLCEAIGEAGEVPPANNHIPPNTRTCRTSLWRSYCYAGTIAESDKPDAKQKAFVRAFKQLQALKLIGVWNDYVWVTGHAGHTRT
jgi:AAA domain